MTSEHKKSSLVGLTLAAVGIVYGDIATSPLYTLKTVCDPTHGLPVTYNNLLGIVPVFFVGLTLIFSFKYVALGLGADNRGEGGIMALMALVLSSVSKSSRWHVPLMVIGVFGATLFYGDSMITPAISVLSAIEGLEVATPAFSPYVVWLTIAVLVGLYSVQSHGTAGIGRFFAPVMLIWFVALACMGVVNIIKSPAILAAINPLHAVAFLLENGRIAFLSLGAVVLALTGAEALYADMGHFGKKPIRTAWLAVAFPCLMLNYLGKARDVMTLAHELGHGVHQVLAAGQGALMASTPLTLAETASVFGEMLTFQALLRQTTDAKKRKALLASKVEDMINTVVRQIAFYTFERKIHTARKEGELTPDQINAIWLEVQTESLGDAIVLGESYETFWTYIPHFIHSPFYVYAYAFGDCLVNSLYARYRESETGFQEKYFAMLKAGGSKHHSELLKPFGLDATDPGFWQKGLAVISGMIDELEGME